MTAAPDPTGPPGTTPERAVPAPLSVAVSLVAVEAVLLVLQGAAEIVALSGQRLAMGLTTAVFFLLYGAGLGLCAWAAYRLKSPARAPIVVAQLIQVLVGWSFLGGGTTWVAVTLVVVALVVLAGVLHPASLAALADD